MKGYSRKISDVYVIPLPYFVKPLPPLIPYNPVSVVMYIWALFKANPLQPRIHGSIMPRGLSCEHAGSDGSGNACSDGSGNECCVRITDPASMSQLWEQGFFGKGTLSRSEPSWFGRTARRLGLDGGELTLEEVTEMRRAKRRQFKKDRELQQWQELVDKKRKEGATDLPAMPSSTDERRGPDLSVVRQEDLALVRGHTIERLEYLQLSPYEAVFLHFGLGVLELDADAATVLKQLLPTLEDWHNYVVYHYYRSLGWCVRDGVKFGADFLVYQKGPPFMHAKFAVLVSRTQPKPWWWLHMSMRVLGGAKKTLTLAYVEPGTRMPEWDRIRGANDFRRELAKHSVRTITCTRFSPSKTRD